MPGKKVKDLYVAKSLAELTDKTKITKLDYSPKVLQSSAKVLRGHAEKDLLKGDQEMSYILFMKFVELALHVKRMKGVSEKEFEETFGGQNVKYAMNKLEELQKSLTIRYAELAKSREKTYHAASESSPKSVKEEKEKSKNSGDLSNGSLDGKQSSLKLEERFSGSSISSWDLRNLIMEGKFHVLLMDTRSASDYSKSHMCFNGAGAYNCRSDLTTVINVPKDIIKIGLIPSSLEKLLPVESLIGWSKRKESDLIVLIDWDTDDCSSKTDSSVFILKEIMTKWELNFSYKQSPIILERGYFDWVNTFPMMTTNPHLETPVKTKGSAAIIPNNDFYLSNLLNQDEILDDLDDVVYPALIDSPPKVAPTVLEENSAIIPAVLPTVTKSASTSEKGLAPVIDRSSKPAVAALPSPKASPILPTITKVQKPTLPSVPVEIPSSEPPKEIPESKSESEIVAREKPQPEPLKVEKKVENEEETKEEVRGPPKNANIPVVNRSLKAKVLQQQGEEERGQTVSAEPRRGSKEDSDPEENRKSSEVFGKQNKNANFLREEAKEKENNQQRKQIDKDVWTIPLNSEPSPGSSSMKRSRSLQNVSRLVDDQELPKVNRSIKPVNKPLEAKRRIFDGVYGNVTQCISSPMETSSGEVFPQVCRNASPEDVSIGNEMHQVYKIVDGTGGRGLTGLRNLGNSCYMNSILQCINHTPTLVKYFCDGKYRDDVNRSTKMKGEVAEEVAALVRALWGGEYRSIACRDLKGVVGMHKKAFAGYEQQDSHEFLTILMDWLHEDLNRAGQRSIQNSNYNSEGQNASGLEGAVKAWKEFCSKNESLVLQLFYGQQASTVRCLTCGEESVTYEPFSNLSLPLPPNATRCTLSDCMSLYLKGEHITGWNCPRCKEPRDAIKKFDIWILPQILVIHFKRFTSDGWCRKRQTMVDFPLEDLDVSSWVAMDPSSGGPFPHHKRLSQYNLYGVSNHYGTMDGGHYTAHCKSSIFHKWYKFDDHEVSELSPSDVVSPAAYILFYSSVDVS